MTPAHRSFAGRLLAGAVLVLAIIAISCSDDSDQPTASPAPSSPGSGSFEASPSSGDGALPAPSSVLGGPDYDAARALEHVHKLSVEIGRRPAGSAAEKQAADYIREQLAGYGYQSDLQGFTFEISDYSGTTLAVVSPRSQEIAVRALEPTVAGSIEGEIVAAGIGHTQEFPSGSTGKIVLMQRGELTFSEKVANAAAAGATGAIIYNNQPGAFVGQLSETSAIPAVSVSKTDGEALLALLVSGPVTVRLNVVTKVNTEGSQNVVANAPGHPCRVVLGGHYDSVPAGPGANDNASGTATVLEIARSLAADGQMDDVCFALFGSEEIGLVGSAHYVEALTPQQKNTIVGMLNFDMLAVGSGWPLLGSQKIVDVAASQAQQLGLSYDVSTSSPANVGSDHASFIDAGIPAILFNCFCDPHYHTAEDQFEFVQQRRLGEAGALGLAVVNALLKG